MTLTAGRRLGVYEVTALVGEGGMGQVWKAHDTTLGRQVAIKILPDEFAADPDRVARFEREARMLARLNHPNIAAIYGFERFPAAEPGKADVATLVMEFVDGDDLSKRGPMRVEEALPIAKQIAAALEAAHEQGITHRDLKPANIKVRDDGTVKVLDFGLAKVMTRTGSARDDASTVILPEELTTPSVIVGTAAYMSPEQAQGLDVDHRSDIFAFGSVVYEMVTGHRAFPGRSAADSLASVIAREPDWSALASVDQRLTRLLRRCCAKSRRDRWQAIGDVRAEIEFIMTAPEPPQTTAAPRSRLTSAWPLAATAIAAAALSAWAVAQWRPEQPRPVTRFSVMYPQGTRYGNPNRRLVAISPDGAQLVISTQQGLSIRSMATGESRSLVDGDALNPAFSPDSKSVAFSRGNSLWRISISGGAPTRLQAPGDLSAFRWADIGIVGTTGNQIVRIDPDGAAPKTIAEVTAPQRIGRPQVLPDGKTLLLTIAPGPASTDWEQSEIVTQVIGTTDRRVVSRGGMDAEYIASGHLLYVQGGVLFAAPFDVSRLQITAEATPVVKGMLQSSVFVGIGQFTVGEEGTLAYAPGPVRTPGQASVTITSSTGEVAALDLPPAAYATPRFSPDGKSIAFGINDANHAIWVYELSGASTMRRLTFDGQSRYPVWSRDGQRIAFQMERPDGSGIFWRRADGSGGVERLTTAAPRTSHVPELLSPDGTLFYSVMDGDTSTLWTVKVPGGSPRQLDGIVSRIPLSASLSADGKWLAYSFNDKTRSAVFVEPYPPTGAKYQASADNDDAHHPLWSPDGRRLFYIPGPSTFVSVGVTYNPVPVFGTPAPVARGFYSGNSPINVRGHDISPDGTRFVGVVETGAISLAQSASTVEVVRNWFEELKARPAAR